MRDYTLINLKAFHNITTHLLNPGIDIVVPKFHYEMLETYFNNDRMQLLVCPVGFAKSTTLKNFGLFTLLCDKETKFVLYLTSTKTKAIQQFTSFTRLLENDLLKLTYKYKIVESNKTTITIENEHGIQKRIYGASSGEGISGITFEQIRPNLIIIDDLEELDRAKSETLTEDTIEWLLLTLKSRLPSTSLGRMRMIGTNLTQNSIINRVLKNLPDKNGNTVFAEWKHYLYQALKDGKSIWEARFTTDSLLKEEQQNPFAFASNFMNEPLDIKSSLIKLHNLRYYDEYSKVDINQISIYADLTHTAKKTSDYVAIGVIGKSFDNQYYLLDYILDKITPEQSKHALINLYLKYKDKNVIRVAYDATSQDYWTEAVQKIATKEYNISLPIEGIKTNKDKVYEFNSIINVFTANNFFFNTQFLDDNEARKQLLLFPNGKHDDFVDMLTHALKVFEVTDPNQRKTVDLNHETVKELNTWEGWQEFNPFYE
jgi:predicted phage terminase large subunit-like protein